MRRTATAPAAGGEIEEHFECFMELFGFIPSLTNPDRTVLDEFRELNLAEPIESHCRLVEKEGQPADFSTLGLSTAHALQLGKLTLATEERLGAVTIEQFLTRPSWRRISGISGARCSPSRIGIV